MRAARSHCIMWHWGVIPTHECHPRMHDMLLDDPYERKRRGFYVWPAKLMEENVVVNNSHRRNSPLGRVRAC